MGRPQKTTVDYFPHTCNHKKTIFILEERYGNNGYAFWFKLLEILGNTPGHCLDLGQEENMEFLQAKTHLGKDSCAEILCLLAKLQAIDPEAWEHKRVWSQNFIDGIAEVYKNRRVEIPQKPSFNNQKPAPVDIPTDENPPTLEFSVQPTDEKRQSKLEYSKVKETIVKESKDKSTHTLYGEFHNVSLSDEELKKLKDKFGEVKTNEWIEVLSKGKASKGYKYKNDYAAILTWSRREEPKGQGNKPLSNHAQQVKEARESGQD